MNTYKITNITNLAAKRDVKYNSSLNIEYVDKMTKKVITLRPNDVVYLKIPSLPLSVQRLRVKNLITVSEIDETELTKTINTFNTDVKTKAIIIDDEEKKSYQKSRKKSLRKDGESDID